MRFVLALLFVVSLGAIIFGVLMLRYATYDNAIIPVLTVGFGLLLAAITAGAQATIEQLERLQAAFTATKSRD